MSSRSWGGFTITFRISPDASTVLFATEQSTPGTYAIFVAPIDGSQPAMLLAATGLLIDQQNSFALLVLSAAGAVGFAFVLGLFRSLQADIAALQESASAVL